MVTWLVNSVQPEINAVFFTECRRGYRGEGALRARAPVSNKKGRGRGEREEERKRRGREGDNVCILLQVFRFAVREIMSNDPLSNGSKYKYFR